MLEAVLQIHVVSDCAEYKPKNLAIFSQGYYTLKQYDLIICNLGHRLLQILRYLGTLYSNFFNSVSEVV